MLIVSHPKTSSILPFFRSKNLFYSDINFSFCPRLQPLHDPQELLS